MVHTALPAKKRVSPPSSTTPSLDITPSINVKAHSMEAEASRTRPPRTRFRNRLPPAWATTSDWTLVTVTAARFSRRVSSIVQVPSGAMRSAGNLKRIQS